jgi:transcriptional regulator with XRE-family HTH domain
MIFFLLNFGVRYVFVYVEPTKEYFVMVDECKSNNIKILMQKHGLTIEELADELDVSISTINRLLVGTKIDPRLSTLRPLAKFFEISIEELMGDKPLNVKLKDKDHFIDNKQTLLQVPIIHWEQVKNAADIVHQLNFDKWDNWMTIFKVMSDDAYALQIQQSSLPPPFYFQSIIVIDPGKEPKDSDYALIMHKENPLLTKVILNGIQRLYRSLILEQIFADEEIRCCGTIVQWTICYCEK